MRANAASARRVDLLGELRARGFARGDTEQMRLILEAFANLAAPTRRTRRLMRRPYFPDARLFFEMMAPTYSIDSTRTLRFLADPDGFQRESAPAGAIQCAAGRSASRTAPQPPQPRTIVAGRADGTQRPHARRHRARPRRHERRQHDRIRIAEMPASARD